MENGRGFALGEKPAAPSPYVTWACYDDEKGQRQYEWGHYGSDLAAMEQDFTHRVQDYQRLYHVEAVGIEAPGLYKYYSTQRPVDIGTFPKPPHNAPDEIVNYDQRVPVEGGAFLAWGHLTYTKPLTEKQMADYELRPSPEHPHRDMEKRPPIAEQLKEAGPQKGCPRPGRQIGGAMENNPFKNAELSVEQNYDHIDGLINNLPLPPQPPEKELDKVKEPPRNTRSREREER